MTKEQLAKRIAEVSLLRGEFTLRSGRKSNYYLDKYRFETQPDVLKALGELFARHVGAKVDRIAGAELGAVPLAAATSMASGKPCVFIRNQKKDYGTAKQIEGVLNAGETVLIVEDVLTTGGQVLEAAKVLKELVAHHVEEEERNIWAQVRKNFSDEQRARMNRDFLAAKKAVRV